MIKGAKVLRNAQVVDRFAPNDFLSALRHDQTRKLLDTVIGSMEPERDYIINLHQDEQGDDLHVMITNTVSFEPVVRCRDCRYYEHEVFTFGERKEYHCCNRDWNGEPVLSGVEPDGFCAWGERRDA